MSKKEVTLEEKKEIAKQKHEDKIKFKEAKKIQKQLLKQAAMTRKKYSTRIIRGDVIATTGIKPDLEQYIIEVSQVRKSYTQGANSFQVLKNIDLKIKRGDFVVILGPSGSGKTTLLNVISGLDTIDSGDILVDGYNIALLKDKHLTEFRRNKIGFVFQQYNLLPHLTAKENAEVGANLNRNKKSELKIDKIFKMIWLEDHMHKFPYQLSGGQQQRVSIARALAKEPSILFCDEPTGALDEATGRIVLEVLVNINKKNKTTIILVTHNPNIAEIANSVITIMNGGIQSHKTIKDPKSPKEINWA